jgi:TP901 family phage tail tape measure protein
VAQRNVSVRFTAEIQGFRRAMDEAAAATRRTADAAEESSAAADTYLGRMVESANQNTAAWEKAGGTLLGVGTAAVAGIGLAGKAAMDWETAWAGVTKTVDGTPAQMDELEASLRGLAKTLPATHEEIAGVAEAAGQLGVKREDVVGFTKTMIDLGESTNLSADEAATAIAQISNVMGTMARDGSKGVERFGATLVALGNAGASTELEIVDMAKRIAGAAKLVGASESDVLALANAMASVGIEAQLGGGVISRVMQRMYGDVKTGGEGLDNLAKVAGVSSKEFATAFETDPVRAVDSMVKGLGRIKDEGGNVIDTMSNLGIKGTEETGVILRLAGAGDLLADSLKLGDEAWESNSALAEEAAKRYETTESKVKIAWNNIKDAAIEAGAVLLPMIAGVAESAAGIAQAFGSLPEPVKGALTVLGGVAGIAALGAGAFLTLTPKILDTMNAFRTLAPAGSRAATVLNRVGKAAGIAAGIAIVGTILAKIVEAGYMEKIDTGMGRVSLALAEIGTNGPGAETALDQIFKDRDGGGLTDTVSDLDSAIKRTFNPDVGQQISDWGSTLMNNILGVEGSTQILEGGFERLDQGLADLVSGGSAGEAAKSFEQIKKTAEEQGVSVEELAKKFPQYADALKAAEAASKTAAAEGKNLDGSLTDVGAAAEVAAERAEEIEKALEEIGLAADGTVTDLVKFTDALINAGLLQLSARDAARGFEAAIDAMAESLKENGRTLDTTTEKGRANEAALDAIAGAGFRSASAMAANGASQEDLQGNLKATHDRLVEAARQFTNTDEEAQALARDIMKIPPGVNIDSWMSDQAKRMAQATTGELDKIDGRIVRTKTEITIETLNRQINTSEYREDPSMVAFRPGGFTGGRVSDLMGFVGGGIVPGSPPSDPRKDNILAMVNGKPLKVRSGEWIINEGSSRNYDRELAAINAGTFPKLPGYTNGARVGREYAAQPSFASSAAAGVNVAAPNVTVMIGNEQLDGRMFSVASSAMSGASRGSSYQRGGHQ